jgi:hypothetical protein
MDYQQYLDKLQQLWRDWQYRSQTNLTPFWTTIIVLVLLGNTALIYYNFFYSPKSEVVNSVDVQATNGNTETVSALTGLPINEEKLNMRPVAVMIDNYGSDQPQSGVGRAAIVFETYVEGGVTRLMAVFQTNEDVTIGPVRSAREYFLPLAKSLDAVYAHSGGSPTALNELAKGEIDDADEFKYGSAFYRSRLYFAPHNLFTTTRLLADLALSKNWTDWDMQSSFSFNEEAPSGETAEEISVRFSLPEYNVRWSYDNGAEDYRRFAGGNLVYDSESEKIVTAKNIVILYTEVRPAPRVNYPDALYVETVGSGDALFVRNGVAVDGTWRISKTGQLEFSQINGAPYSLAPGNTWIEIISADIPGNVAVK